jgi:hypothetical protein
LLRVPSRRPGRVRPGAWVLNTLAACAVASLAATGLVGAQSAPPQERVAALKQSLAESQVSLRNDEWVETTVVSLKGEEKSRKQNRCYYGAEGQVQKLPVEEAAPASRGRKRRGVRGRVAEKKKGELTDYMKRAVNLVHMYVPPDPGRIQRSKDAGEASIHMLDPGKRARLEFGDYLEKGDSLGIEMDLVTNRLLVLTVSSYLGTPDDPVGLNVQMGSLQDGTGYPARISLDAQAQKLNVTIENSGYRKLGP